LIINRFFFCTLKGAGPSWKTRQFGPTSNLLHDNLATINIVALVQIVLSDRHKETSMQKRLWLALSFSAMTATTVIQAEEDHHDSAYHDSESAVDERWYVAPFGTFFHPGGDRNADDDWGGGLGIGKMINEYFNLEVKGFWQHLNGQRNDGDLTGGTVDVQYYLMRGSFAPYTVVGVGGMNTTAGGRSSASIIGEAGIGAAYELHDNFLLRGDVRYRYSFEGDGGVYPREDDFHDMVVNVGFVVPFGPKPQRVAEVAPTPVPQDECANRDTDHDGINDCDDRCPGTLKEAKVDDQGCPLRIELKGVNFLYDSSQLTENAQRILDAVAEQLMAFPEQRAIEVAGHTSSEGSNAYNLKLSQKRSESVARYLKMRGVTNRLYPKGYGENQPVADNRTNSGRERNRRVELIWMGD
jgi:OOP family OmpA-OmpF porin